MSSSHPPPDCALQLPSWDEFDQTEELDNSESDHEPDERGSQRPTAIGPTLPPGFDGGSSRVRDVEELSSIPPDVQHGHGRPSSSFCDQLPSSIAEHPHEQTSSSASESIGPALPPGFTLNGSNEEEEDPEDPGDPDDPDESDSRSKVPTLHCGGGEASSLLPGFSMSGSSSGRVGLIGPAVPPGFSDFSPSLPDEEIRPRSQGTASSLTMPPPEPEETRVPTWSSKADMPVASNSRRLIGPAVPDLLPTVSHFENADDDEEEEAYGPAVPPDLNPGPSTSNSRDTDLEMPVEGDEHCVHDDDSADDVIGPMPPCESGEAVQREYKQRLSAYEAQRACRGSVNKREEWMVKLPKKLHTFGLGARTFSKSGNGTVADEEGARQWTETPYERSQRLAGQPVAGPSSDSSLRHAHNPQKDAVQEQRAAQLNKDRNISMLEIHQRKRKLESATKELSDESSSRRPFDRERDMQVQGIRGGLGVAELKERCGQLSSRFGHSSSQKFL
uniref:DUF3752 domain-containing protein n=1 Tax=Ascaris suum TaxID=6253 RepID=F1L3D7_ASCSU